VLAVGDVFGKPGLTAVERWLPGLRQRSGAGHVVVNVENLHEGRGADPPGVRAVLDAGADVLTSGNHIWGHKSAASLLEKEERLLRPANYPEPCPGRGVRVDVSPEGVRIATVNLLGRVFLSPVDSPFDVADALLEETAPRADVVVVDVHAEATSEKMALAHHLDGRVAAVFGTHTHVQTADARILPGGTAFLTDLGMTGPYDSVIGKEVAPIVRRFVSGRPVSARTASGGVGLRGALFTIDEASGRATGVERVALGEGGA
jgi:hypothetical protein